MNFQHFIIPKNIKNQLDTDNKKNKIVVRFPPEPSGYLHIGHIKALYINACISKKYNCKLIIRMDDTNPVLESDEYEKAILEDLTKLGIDTTNVSYTSDYFDKLLEYAEELIKNELAYVDLTDSQIMKEERKKGIESKYRNNTIENNIKLWIDIKNGTINGCLRMKIDMNHKNYAMRDFTLYRSVKENHHRVQNKYKVYPTYDFSCPIVDSLQGITHVFRSNEYIERDEQNNFILDKLNLNKPRLYHYGKFMIEGAELSKRKIKKSIQDGLYDGWDDPKLYTMRGLFNRGIYMEALEEIMKDTGYSVLDIKIEPSKIWSINKKIIDKIATRFMVVKKDSKIVSVELFQNDNFDFNSFKMIDKFIKNKNLGNRKLKYSKNIYINAEDYELIQNNEEVTLINYMNVFKKDGNLLSNINGDYKTTEKKLIWVQDKYNDVKIISYSTNNNNLYTENYYYGEIGMDEINIGDYVQLLKMNYYICIGKNINYVELLELPLALSPSLRSDLPLAPSPSLRSELPLALSPSLRSDLPSY